MSITAQPADGAGPPPAAGVIADSGERWSFGLIAVGIGTVSLLFAFVFVCVFWREDKGLAALGVIASPISAMVSAYFGVHASAGAVKQAQASAAESRVNAAQAQVKAATAEGDKTKALSDVASVLSRLDPSIATEVREGLNFK